MLLFDIWSIGFAIGLILVGLGLLCGLIGIAVQLLDDDPIQVPLRLAAMSLVAGPVIAAVWPVWAIAGIVYLLGYGVFTTARVVRHRSFDF